MSKSARRIVVFAALVALVLVLAIVGQGVAQEGPELIERQGESSDVDETLSEPADQSCASCHEPALGS